MDYFICSSACRRDHNKAPYIKDSYYSALTTAMGITNTQFAFLLTAYGIMNTIVYIPGGFLADRFSPKLLVVISCFGTGLAGIWYSFLPPYPYLVAIHAAFGITTVFTFWAAMVKITNNLGSGDEQGKMFGLLEGGRGLIGTLVAMGSVWVFERFANEVMGVRGIIMYYSIAMMVAGVLSIIFIKDPAKIGTVEDDGTKQKWSDFKIVMKIPRVWLCGIVVACNYTAVILFGYITPYLTEVYGLSNSGAAVLGIFRSYVLMFAASMLAGTASGIISIVGYAPEMFAYTLAGSLMDKNPGVIILKKSNDAHGKMLAEKHQ